MEYDQFGNPINDSLNMFQNSNSNMGYQGSSAMNPASAAQTNNFMSGLQGINSGTNNANQGGGIFDNFAGKDGWGNTAVAGASALANSWLGFENLGVAKDQYGLEKEQYEYNKSNYDAALKRKADALAHS